MAGKKDIQISKRAFRYGVERERNRSGFSLIELLTVIAIISLLLSILTPSLGRTRAIARRLKCAHNLKQIDVAMHMYLNGNDDLYPCAEDPLPTGYWLWMGRGWRDFVKPYLGGNINANNPSILWCPQDKVAKEKYESTSYAYSMAFYHSPAQLKNMDDPSYTCGDGPSVQSVPQRSISVAKPTGKIVIGEWNSNHLRVLEKGWYGFGGWWCWEGSRNYLFVDGHVCYLAAEEIRPAQDGWPNPNLTVGGIKGVDWPP